MRQLFRELKRRNVYRVAVTYAAVAIVTLQAARLIFPATALEGVYDVLVLVAFVGFVITHPQHRIAWFRHAPLLEPVGEEPAQRDAHSKKLIFRLVA